MGKHQIPWFWSVFSQDLSYTFWCWMPFDFNKWLLEKSSKYNVYALGWQSEKNLNAFHNVKHFRKSQGIKNELSNFCHVLHVKKDAMIGNTSLLNHHSSKYLFCKKRRGRWFKVKPWLILKESIYWSTIT